MTILSIKAVRAIHAAAIRGVVIHVGAIHELPLLKVRCELWYLT